MINKVIAILPMRLGSKRVKNKNIRKINNKLLFEYILNTLQKSKHIDEIVINTDIPKYFFKYCYNFLKLLYILKLNLFINYYILCREKILEINLFIAGSLNP